MNDFIWRIRAAIEFARRMGPGWYLRAWAISEVLLESREDQTPEEAVDNELACWDD